MKLSKSHYFAIPKIFLSGWIIDRYTVNIYFPNHLKSNQRYYYRLLQNRKLLETSIEAINKGNANCCNKQCHEK